MSGLRYAPAAEWAVSELCLKALIDGDILIYRIGYTTQDVELPIAQWRMDDTIRTILRDLDTEDYHIYLTSSDRSNYRYKLYDKYKANRKAEKPLWYNELRAHLLAAHPTTMVFDQEADDAIGIAANRDSVVVSIDKDLDQIAGKHYNFVKQEHYGITEAEGLRFFYFQLLRGDPADNIPGCQGIGPKKADRALHGAVSEDQMYDAALRLYTSVYGDKGPEYLVTFARLLKIRQTSDEGLWLPPDQRERNPSIEAALNESSATSSRKRVSKRTTKSSPSTTPVPLSDDVISLTSPSTNAIAVTS
jgi:hypothetical protein